MKYYLNYFFVYNVYIKLDDMNVTFYIFFIESSFIIRKFLANVRLSEYLFYVVEKEKKCLCKFIELKVIYSNLNLKQTIFLKYF